MQRLEAAESLQRGDSVPATARLQRALRGSGPRGASSLAVPISQRGVCHRHGGGLRPGRKGGHLHGAERDRKWGGARPAVGRGRADPLRLKLTAGSLSRLETEGDTGWRSRQCPGPALLRAAALRGQGRPARGPWGQDQVLAVAEPARAFERRAQGLFRVGTAASFVLLTQQCYFYCRHFLTQDQSSTKNPARSPIST